MGEIMLTPSLLAKCMPAAKLAKVAEWCDPLNAAMEANGINTVQRCAGFLASVANETGQLSASAEASYYGTPYERIVETFRHAAPSLEQIALWKTFGRARFDVEFFNWVYDDRVRGPNWALGNPPGEGFKWRGRGPGQITGKPNYLKAFKRLGLPADSDPDILLDPVKGAMAFGDYWRSAGNNERMDRGDFRGAMYTMNSGLKEFAAHEAHYARVLKVLQAEPKPVPVTPTEAAKQVAGGQIGKAAVVAAIPAGISIADAAVKVSEAKATVETTKGLLAMLGLPSPYTEIVLGVLTVGAIAFIVWRYGRKLLLGEAIST